MSETIHRRLICPVCSAILTVPCNPEDGGIPGEFLLPRHMPAGLGYGNICAAYRVTIRFDPSRCDGCGREMCDHPTGLCQRCFSKGTR
jgi:hypothetical protein